MRTLTWTWSSYRLDIRIFDGEKQIGRIPHFDDQAVGIINGKRFFVENPKWTWKYYITDPEDNKAYCEMSFSNWSGYKMFSPAFEYCIGYDSFWPLKRRVYLTSKGIRILELEIPGGFFKTKGELKVYKGDRMELAIYALFYLNQVQTGD